MIGVGIIYYCLKWATLLLSEKLGLEGFRSGEYGSPPSFIYWLRQFVVYLSCLTVMKLVVVGLFALWPGIFKIGKWLLSWLGNKDAAQVILYVAFSSSLTHFTLLIVGVRSVMGLFPIIMNVVQFWLIDSIVKAHTPPVALTDSSSRLGAHDDDQEPLFQGDGSDEEDETVDEPRSTPSKHDVENPETLTTPAVTKDPRPLTPDAKSFPSGSSTPFRGEADPDDVAMNRVRSPSPPPTQRPTTAKSTVPTAGDEWAWDEAREEWGVKQSLDASRPHHD